MTKNKLLAVSLFGFTVSLASCGSITNPSSSKDGLEVPHFIEAGSDIINFEQRSRRKWDNPFIADLDQNGFMDIVVTDHAYQASVFWNNGGTFSDPVTVVTGDTHGAASGDIDGDGRIDLLISQGGGGGKNPRFPIVYQVNKDRTIEGGEPYDHFERSRGRAIKLVDADNNTSLNLLTSGFPLPTQKALGANFIYDNKQPRTFEFASHLPSGHRLSYKATISDYNNDGIYDAFFYGGQDITVAKGESGLKFSDATKEVLGDLAKKITDASSMSEIDFDNDGDFDLFISRAKHQFQQESYFDVENKRFAFFTRFKAFQYDDLKIDGDFTLENLQMAYPHFDVFIGAEKRPLTFEVDKHGEKNFTLTPKDAEGWPEEITAKGLYIGYVGKGMWRVGGHTKSPTAGVIHNVLSTPSVIDVAKEPAYLLENRDGKFVDVTAKMGIDILEQTQGSAAGDFNNDGWTDLFVVRYGNMATQNQQILYLNQGGQSFKRIDNHGIISKELGATGSGAEAFDYDQDGDLDIVYSNERGRWHLFTNNAQTLGNNYIVVKVNKSPSGKANSIGALLSFTACNNSYKRVVGATSAPSSHNSNSHLHVGLGKCASITDASVTWTNGEVQTLDISKLNQSIIAGTTI